MANDECNTASQSELSTIIPSPFIKDDLFYTTTRPVTADEVVDTAKAIIAERFTRYSAVLLSSRVAKDYYISQLADREYEVFCVTYLDTRNRVIAFEELFRGTLNQAMIYPREVVRQALKHNAAAVILTHNHPAGTLKPSDADVEITLQLKQALALIDIKINDHIIVAGALTYSFADYGLL